ncbi:MAG: sigma-54-dependent Fis family transcriptional regulator [Sandaracinus sp.]|nr:sigma-54-dependent Fis family transcriptional regulator [Sandaracinus sp.]MCB9613650.1 sigma-54-dependent Fis family transcriptional regulator [Sandaracinus sp.]MCB9622574.1 sigma-54-dependent Fis family transcriptional regulator [Sandaracinus sp.]
MSDDLETTETPFDPSTRPGRVLIVDDEANARSALAELLEDEGYVTATASDGVEALEKLETFTPEVVLTDLKMPRMDGLALLEEGKKRQPSLAFVVMTAFGSIDTAVEAIKRGAENYLTKPLDVNSVAAIVARALEKARLSAEAALLRAQVDKRLSFGGILGDHPTMQRVLKIVGQVAPTRATVLITGESGTGKELVAAALHHNSARSKAPFIRLNCASLAETLLESELFGHERGSFTGAEKRRAGRFEQAHGGTLFLDEVSEIPMATQVKLLRFLQERELERVGGNETIRVDVRVVAASNRDLRQMVADGTFREDLYYRLNVVQIEMPPLRVRRSDIPTLAHHFLRKYREENKRPIEGFTDAALRALVAYPWPGNVRELENAVERAVVLCEGPMIDTELLPSATGPAMTRPPENGGGGLDLLIPGITMGEVERIVIERTLESVGGSTARAAEVLGISRRTIQYRLKEWRGASEIDPDE